VQSVNECAWRGRNIFGARPVMALMTSPKKGMCIRSKGGVEATDPSSLGEGSSERNVFCISSGKRSLRCYSHGTRNSETSAREFPS